MAADSSIAKLRHLDQASELLSIASPAVSSYLQTTRSSLARDNEGGRATLSSRPSCNACGNIMIPGWSCSYIRDATSRKRKSASRIQRNSGAQSVKTVKLRCHACNEVNQSRTEKPAVSRKKNEDYRSKPSVASRMLDTQPETRSEAPRVHEEDQTKPAGNGGTSIAKKRARGKKAGLEAMLAKGKASQSATKSNGFDIMDFMKG